MNFSSRDRSTAGSLSPRPGGTGGGTFVHPLPKGIADPPLRDHNRTRSGAGLAPAENITGKLISTTSPRASARVGVSSPNDHAKNPHRPPPFIVCSLCQQQFTHRSIAIHVPQCYAQRMREWEMLGLAGTPPAPYLKGLSQAEGSGGLAPRTKSVSTGGSSSRQRASTSPEKAPSSPPSLGTGRHPSPSLFTERVRRASPQNRLALAREERDRKAKADKLHQQPPHPATHGMSAVEHQQKVLREIELWAHENRTRGLSPRRHQSPSMRLRLPSPPREIGDLSKMKALGAHPVQRSTQPVPQFTLIPQPSPLPYPLPSPTPHIYSPESSQPPPQKFCSMCGFRVTSMAAKFCQECGCKL